MAIREQGYRHWDGTYTGHAFRWWTITKATLRSTVYTKGRVFGLLLMLGLAWMVPFFFGLFYYFGGDLEILRSPDETLRENLYDMFATWQWMWGVVFSGVIGSRLVANDLRSEALYIYLAKPLRRIDYILGKLLAAILWLIPVTLLPALWVYAAASGSTNKLFKLQEGNEILGEIFIVHGLFILLCASCAVAISSFTKRWTLALIGWIGFMFLLFPLGQITAEASKAREWLYLSPRDDVMLVAREVWERPLVRPDWEPALLIVSGLILAALTAFAVRIARIQVSE